MQKSLRDTQKMIVGRIVVALVAAHGRCEVRESTDGSTVFLVAAGGAEHFVAIGTVEFQKARAYAPAVDGYANAAVKQIADSVRRHRAAMEGETC